MVLALGAPGIGPLLIVLVVVLIVFGPKRIPALARQVGAGLRELRKSVGGDDHDHLPGGDPEPPERTAARDDASQPPRS